MFVLLTYFVLSFTELHKYSSLWRTPRQLERLRRFLIQNPMKQHVLECFATGFVSHFEYKPPRPWGSVHNYHPITDTIGTEKFRCAMEKEIRGGRMIGGPG